MYVFEIKVFGYNFFSLIYVSNVYFAFNFLISFCLSFIVDNLAEIKFYSELRNTRFYF